MQKGLVERKAPSGNFCTVRRPFFGRHGSLLCRIIQYQRPCRKYLPLAVHRTVTFVCGSDLSDHHRRCKESRRDLFLYDTDHVYALHCRPSRNTGSEFWMLPETLTDLQGHYNTGGSRRIYGAGAATAMRLGCPFRIQQRGRLGTSPMIHASAKTDHPAKQGLMGAFEVFEDTIVVCSMTGLVVIITGYWNSGLQGSEPTLTAFESGMGSIGESTDRDQYFLFGLTTSTGWFTYYSVILKHWLKNNRGRF